MPSKQIQIRKWNCQDIPQKLTKKTDIKAELSIQHPICWA